MRKDTARKKEILSTYFVSIMQIMFNTESNNLKAVGAGSYLL